MPPPPPPPVVVDACPCYLVQGMNELQSILGNAAHPEASLRDLKRALNALEAKYEEHIRVWRERYALNQMELVKQATLAHHGNETPLQTSAWKHGDQKRLLEPKKKKTKRVAPQTDVAVYVAPVKKESLAN